MFNLIAYLESNIMMIGDGTFRDVSVLRKVRRMMGMRMLKMVFIHKM